MRSFGLPESPYYITYVIYGLLLCITVLVFKKTRTTKNQKKGCGLVFFYLLAIAPFCYMLLGLLFGSIHALYGVGFYPKYEAKIVDSVSKYSHRGNMGTEIYLLYPILELKNNSGHVIQIEGNEGSKENPIIGEKTIVSYEGGIVIKRSFWSIVMYIGTILVSVVIIGVLLFVFFSKI